MEFVEKLYGKKVKDDETIIPTDGSKLFGNKIRKTKTIISLKYCEVSVYVKTLKK